MKVIFSHLVTSGISQSHGEHRKGFPNTEAMSPQFIADIIMLANQIQPGQHVWYCLLLRMLGLMKAVTAAFWRKATRHHEMTSKTLASYLNLLT